VEPRPEVKRHKGPLPKSNTQKARDSPKNINRSPNFQSMALFSKLHYLPLQKFQIHDKFENKMTLRFSSTLIPSSSLPQQTSLPTLQQKIITVYPPRLKNKNKN